MASHGTNRGLDNKKIPQLYLDMREYNQPNSLSHYTYIKASERSLYIRLLCFFLKGSDGLKYSSHIKNNGRMNNSELYRPHRYAHPTPDHLSQA